jgi:large subunit ribosomal protein L4
MALASRIADDEITLIDSLHFEQPKTHEMVAVLKALKLDQVHLLVAVSGYDLQVYKSIRNLANVSVLPVAELNALNVLHPRRLLMTTAALDAFRRNSLRPAVAAL